MVGIDNRPQPRYVGDAFLQMDFLEALAMLADGTRLTFSDGHAYSLHEFDAIHASPPCQRYAAVTRWRGRADTHDDLLVPTIEYLETVGIPWVVENVPGAPMEPHFILCGSMFDVPVRRHRWFRVSWAGFALMPPCNHRRLLPFMHKGERAYADAMECSWMTVCEARQAIPPAYTEFIGRRLMEATGATP